MKHKWTRQHTDFGEFTSLYVTEGEESDTHVTVYSPLLRFTVWTAAVVYKP